MVFPIKFRGGFLLLIILTIWGGIVLFSSCGRAKQDQEISRTFQDPKLTLGHYLFFEKRLSYTHSKSCASCHDPKLAFSDGYRRSPGIYGDLHHRNTPSLLNISSQKYFNRANPDVKSIFEQLDGPLFGVKPIEMGLSVDDKEILRVLSKDPLYIPLINEQLSWEIVKESLAYYVSSLSSFNAPYDAFLAGDQQVITKSAMAGSELFFSSKFNCASCHVPPLFGADSTLSYEGQFANIGLYNYQNGNYPVNDQGLYAITGKTEDKGRFKIPSLRNLSFTAPYFHDGSAEALEDVLQVYADGGRNVTYGNWKGDGRKNPYKHRSITSIAMTPEEKYQLVDFLETLNDSSIFSNPLFLTPFSYN